MHKEDESESVFLSVVRLGQYSIASERRAGQKREVERNKSSRRGLGGLTETKVSAFAVDSATTASIPTGGCQKEKSRD